MRRISTGVQGRPILGNFVADTNNLTTRETNQNIILNPDGSGIVSSDAHIQVNDENSVRFADANSSNYVEIKAPSSVGSNLTLTLPDTVTNGNVLTTDGSGNLSFAQLTTQINNQTTDNSTYYPALISTTSGTVTNFSASGGKLEFQPSTGTLTATILSGNLNSGSVDIDGGNIDGTTIGSNSAADGTFANLTASSITETSSVVLKENIRPISDAVDAIARLEGVTYDRKDGSSTNEAGLIAEEVEKVLPNLVKDKGVHYTKLTVYLLEAVKQLTREIDLLKNKDGKS